MSLILDALKKAESERNRRVAPVLMDARVAPRRRALPLWTWALGAVLVVNLAVLAWLLLRAPAAAPEVAADIVVPPAGPSVDAGSNAATAPPAPAGAAVATPVLPAAPPTVAPGGSPVAATVPSGMPEPAVTDPRTLPTAQSLRATGVALPTLQLELHIYDPSPANRSVLLNGQRLREGEYSPEGLRLERITPEGVVLEASGRRFRLDTGD